MEIIDEGEGESLAFLLVVIIMIIVIGRKIIFIFSPSLNLQVTADLEALAAKYFYGLCDNIHGTLTY